MSEVFTNTNADNHIIQDSMEKKGVNKSCLNCGKKFIDLTHNKSKKHCSDICRNKYKNTILKEIRGQTHKKNCKFCGSEFETKLSHKEYCSSNCIKYAFEERNKDLVSNRRKDYRKNQYYKNHNKTLEYAKNWRKENLSRIKFYQKKFYEQNIEDMRKRSLDWYYKNKEYALERKKLWVERNQDKYEKQLAKYRKDRNIKSCEYCKIDFLANKINQNFCNKTCARKFRESENPEKYKQKAKENRLKRLDKIREYRNKRKPIRNKYELNKRTTDIEYKMLLNIRSRINMALKNNSKYSSTIDLLGCSIEYCKQHLESQFKEGMSWDNHGIDGWHIDHIIPCSTFDLTIKENQKKCFHYSNLQPLWAKENLEKAAKLEVEK
mgnify:CR=1 FL=1